MRETAAQAVLLARAFEEADDSGLLLTAEQRQEATAVARAVGGSDDERAEARATHLLTTLEATVPGLSVVRRATRLPLGILVPLPAIAFVLGGLSNALGPERHVNVMSFPLLGLLVWNVAVYVLLIGFDVLLPLVRRAGEGGAESDAPGSGGWRGIVGGAASWIAEQSLRRVRLPDTPRTTLAARALNAYWRGWSRLAAPLVGARILIALHVGAAFLVLGAVAGMYVRGLTFEYRATWESTFVGPGTAAALLRFVLGPAAGILGAPLPDAAMLESMRAPSDAPAAIWIHLWAITAALVVLLPRGVLAAFALFKERRLARSLAVDPLAGPFRVLLAPDRGAGTAVDVLPYSYGIVGRPADTLRELLHDVFGLRADVRVHDALPYGAEVEDAVAPNGAAPAACAVVVFGFVQSPEREVHGRFVRELLDDAGGRTHVLAVVDSSAWHARFREGDARREGERRRAWDRVLDEAGLSALHIDLAAALETDVVEQAESRLGRAHGEGS
jgi:hypothetical protein